MHGQGPLLVLAGAGSGKTRVITYRVARLIADGEPPESILAVTFTNKAAEEMRERVRKLAGTGRVWISTFHALGARVLRRHADLAGRTPGFSIYDDDDSRALGRRVMQELGLAADKQQLERLLRAVEKSKHRLLDPPAARGLDELERKFYAAYQRKLDAADALDFADLIFRLHRLWRDRPEVLDTYRRRFRHVLVDEFQDTDRAQAGLLKLLCPPGANLCVVGDDDQAIYNWRDADIGHILGFERDWPGARVVRLERNYRSGGAILEAASKLIAHNRRRHEKRLWTEGERGEPVRLFFFADDLAEASGVARAILSARARGEKLSAQAVLYRVNAQSRVLEEAFRLYGLPYRLVGGTRFFDRQEIRDAMAYLRLLLNPRSDIDLLRILNVPARGLGEGTREKLQQLAGRRGSSILEVMREEELGELRPAERRRVLEFRALMDGMQARRARDGDISGAEAVELVLRQSGYREALETSRDERAADRLENLIELGASAADFAARSGDDSLGAFLEHVALVTADDLAGPEAEAVNLMTLHSAKGLEFETVHLVGLEEGLLPHGRSVGEAGEGGYGAAVEEERRLLYVGMTRAKKTLRLSFAESRALFGQHSYTGPSRFLAELEGAVSLGEENGVVQSRADTGGGRPERFELDLDEGDGVFMDGGSEYDQRSESERGGDLVGRYVVHPQLGTGKVISQREGGRGLKLEVAFEQSGRRTVLARFCRPLDT